jgi:hypothetical protein
MAGAPGRAPNDARLAHASRVHFLEGMACHRYERWA